MMRSVQMFGQAAHISRRTFLLSAGVAAAFVGLGIVAYVFGGPDIFREALRSIGGP
jgi:hypothetical protein